MYEDHRVRVAVNFEGYLDYAPDASDHPGRLLPIARYGTDRPLLMLGTNEFTDRQGLNRSWSAALSRSHGHAARRQLERAAHWIFSDYAAFAPQLQAAGLMTAANRVSLVGAASAETSALVRALTRSFFARHI